MDWQKYSIRAVGITSHVYNLFKSEHLKIEIEEGYYHTFQDLFEWINKQIKKKLDNRPGASVQFECLPSKKVLKFYNTLSHAFYIRETVKSDFTADINEGKHHVYVYRHRGTSCGG